MSIKTEALRLVLAGAIVAGGVKGIPVLHQKSLAARADYDTAGAELYRGVELLGTNGSPQDRMVRNMFLHRSHPFEAEAGMLEEIEKGVGGYQAFRIKRLDTEKEYAYAGIIGAEGAEMLAKGATAASLAGALLLGRGRKKTAQSRS